MRSTLDQALVALLNEDQATAEELFHQFVLQRARKINESIVESGDVDADEIVDEAEEEGDEDLAEGKSYKRNDDDADEDGEDVKEKRKKDKEQRDAKKQPVDEGKSYKRNDDDDEDADDKKKKDQERKKEREGKKDKVDEGKTYKRNDDEDEESVEDKKKKDQERKDAAKDKKKVDEGKLELTQGDDGTLVVVHTPEASGDDLGVDPIAPMDAPLGAPMTAPDAAVPPAGPLDAPVPAAPMDDIGDDFGDDLGMDVAPETDMDLSLSDDEFDTLGESLANELEKIVLKNNDGDFAVGGKVKQEKHSPVPNVAAKDRVTKAEPAQIKGATHNGFDREPAPKVDGKEKARNTMTKSTDATKEKSKEGESKALLNQFKDDKAAKSPVGGK